MSLEAFLLPLERPEPRPSGLSDVLVTPPDLAEAGLPLAAPPEIVQAPPVASKAIDSAEVPAASASTRPIEAPTIDAARLDGFLAASALAESAPPPATPTFPQDDSILAPRAVMPAAGPLESFTPQAATTLAVGSPSLAAQSFSPAGGSFGGELGAGIDEIESRLAQVAGRLEQAAERLASTVGGARPRAFRGRIDG